LIDAGADVNYQDENGYTALMYSIFEDNIVMLKTLIKNGADVNYEDYCGRTALMMAISSVNYHKKSMIKRLIQAGSDVNHKNDDGETAMDIAKLMKDKDIIELLSV
jgi:ankyrin repeat protein